jgi:hypothetical protein
VAGRNAAGTEDLFICFRSFLQKCNSAAAVSGLGPRVDNDWEGYQADGDLWIHGDSGQTDTLVQVQFL